MMYFTNKKDRILEAIEAGVQVIGAEITNASVDKMIEKYPELPLVSFRDFIGTRSGPCLILGYGPSRSKMPVSAGMPVFALNRAIEPYPSAEFWCVHDLPYLVKNVDKIVPRRTLITQSGAIYIAPEVATERTILIEAVDDPSRYKKQVKLIWNQTTLGWTIHLAMLMGFDPIYTLGCDLTDGGYESAEYDDKELCRQHVGVRERMVGMFANKHKWYNGKTRIIDLSGGNMPCEKGELPW